MEPIYRYRLERDLTAPLLSPGGRTVLFVMLNPSTATETVDDATIRRVTSFAKRDGFDRLIVVNLFAVRSTDPSKLEDYGWTVACGPENDRVITEEVARADTVVAAWGAVTGPLADRARYVLNLITRFKPVHRLGDLTMHGHPRHPLYLSREARMRLLEPRAN